MTGPEGWSPSGTVSGPGSPPAGGPSPPSTAPRGALGGERRCRRAGVGTLRGRAGRIDRADGGGWPSPGGWRDRSRRRSNEAIILTPSSSMEGRRVMPAGSAAASISSRSAVRAWAGAGTGCRAPTGERRRPVVSLAFGQGMVHRHHQHQVFLEERRRGELFARDRQRDHGEVELAGDELGSRLFEVPSVTRKSTPGCCSRTAEKSWARASARCADHPTRTVPRRPRAWRPRRRPWPRARHHAPATANHHQASAVSRPEERSTRTTSSSRSSRATWATHSTGPCDGDGGSRELPWSAMPISGLEVLEVQRRFRPAVEPIVTIGEKR